MQGNEYGVLLSASDLMRFAGCAHATTLDLARMRGTGAAPVADSEDAELLQRHGDAHEARHLARLKTAGRGVVEIVREGVSLEQGVAATRAALERGAEVVFQGALAGGMWGGWSDFVERVERPSALGAWSYEVADTKLKRKPHPKHVLQLALYSDLLAAVQGVAPEHGHVELGDDTRATIRLAEVSAYARRVRGRLEAFVATPQATRPVPCADCPLCRWREVCPALLAGEDSLFRVANITRGQVAKLEAAGVTTMAALAAWTEPVRGMAPETLVRLVAQAGLQVRRADDGPAFALRPSLPGKGFDLLPAPDPGDIFYDIEGDPHVEGGLEYLHGLWAPDTGFRAIWAHDRAAELAALEAVLDAFRARITAHPGARIFHYAAYEVTALRRLTAVHGVGEAFLDRLLRERRFVDLYAVVRGGVIASEADYSIKSLEVFTGIERKGEVKTAGGSVVAYERWLETRDDGILDEIEEYNRIDCVSTEKLRDWLAAIRPAGPWPALAPDRGCDEAGEDAGAAALRAELAGSDFDAARQRLLFDLGQFHRRDPRQLPQVVQGAHPGAAGLSCLDWLLGEAATVPPDRGILLPETRRMHPDLRRFVSERFYEGRLSSHPDCARQRIDGTRWPATGAHIVAVPHTGNAQVAREEIDVIRAAIAGLTAGTWTDAAGRTRPLRHSDIIVVAPYNAQVNALRAALPERVRVGTVDKFQGQEAPVCLVSMTASSIEDVPRGMGFLFSLERVNVAISRARALALVFASPRLLDARCATVEEVRLVDTLCALPVADAPAALGDAA